MIRKPKGKAWSRRGWKKSTRRRHASRSKTKNLVIMFFDISGRILKHWVPRSQTVNVVYYIAVLKQLQQAAKRPELGTVNNWLLLHDNVPEHCLVKILNFLAYHQTTILEHTAYSSDLAPNDFFLYPKIRENLKRAYFADEEVMKKNCEGVLKHSPERVFQECFNSWKDAEGWREVY